MFLAAHAGGARRTTLAQFREAALGERQELLRPLVAPLGLLFHGDDPPLEALEVGQH